MTRAIRLTELSIPLRRSFSNARGTVGKRRLVLVSITEAGFTGWGEAAPYPGVTAETVADVWEALRSRGGSATEPGLAELPPSARAAIDQARMDLRARKAGMPLWAFIGGRRRSVRACAAVGLQPTPAETVGRVRRAVEAGIGEVKIKIRPGQDLDHLRAVRRAFPGLAVAADANGSYRIDDPFLAAVDGLMLEYVEQPLEWRDLIGHARLRSRIKTPVCLDESTTTPEGALRVIEHGCADVISLKPGLLGVSGVLRIAGRAQEAGVDVKVGGLVETSVGRAHALALASLAAVKFTDLVPPRRMLASDVSDYPWNLVGGRHPLPERPGLGIGMGRFPGAGFKYLVRSEVRET